MEAFELSYLETGFQRPFVRDGVRLVLHSFTTMVSKRIQISALTLSKPAFSTFICGLCVFIDPVAKHLLIRSCNHQSK